MLYKERALSLDIMVSTDVSTLQELTEPLPFEEWEPTLAQTLLPPRKR
jgi:hypothetical protein